MVSGIDARGGWEHDELAHLVGAQLMETHTGTSYTTAQLSPGFCLFDPGWPNNLKTEFL